MGRSLLDFLQQDPKVQIHLEEKGANVNIVSVRAEINLGEIFIQSGRFNRYEFGSFNVENIITEFSDAKFSSFNLNEKKMNMIVSRYCFQHLVDPLGTFVQVHSLLKNDGWLFFTNFFFGVDVSLTEDSLSINFSKRLDHTLEMLDYTDDPFLMAPYANMRKHEIILKKRDMPCQLPFSYLSLMSIREELAVGSKVITAFHHQKEFSKVFQRQDLSRGSIVGKLELYEWLQNNKFMEENESHFISISEN
ncbi:MAG: methyltransferase domain-containing protein [Pseudomonadota bacterium]